MNRLKGIRAALVGDYLYIDNQLVWDTEAKYYKDSIEELNNGTPNAIHGSNCNKKIIGKQNNTTIDKEINYKYCTLYHSG